MIIPESYYTEENEVKLTHADIDSIISELENTSHNLYVWAGYEKIINKLNGGNDGKKL